MTAAGTVVTACFYLAALVLIVASVSHWWLARAADRFERAVADALATVQVEQCPAVVDKRASVFGPVRRWGPAPRCPHLVAGTVAPQLIRYPDGDSLACCDPCYVQHRAVTRDIHELVRTHGVRYPTDPTHGGTT